MLGLLKASMPVLRSKFGKVHVNLGEPIHLDELLQKHQSAMAHRGDGQRGVARAVDGRRSIDDLADRIVTGINAAAAVTPVNLVAMAMLATPRQSLPESALVSQLELYQQLLRAAPYGRRWSP